MRRGSKHVIIGRTVQADSDTLQGFDCKWLNPVTREYDVVHQFHDLKNLPLEVWLLDREKVEAILLGMFVPFPGRADIIALPIFRRHALSVLVLLC